ncbi:MAG: MFS transporter [Myxococcales bacterium]|nr:MFS transporter [Myxococcales bacterium]
MKPRSPLLPIFLIVLIDVFGFTMVMPLLGFYAERFGASPLTATLIVSSYAVCSLISSPILGRLSDRYGRRPLLLVSQVGTCIGFLVLGFADSLWMVFLGRVLDGVTAGNLTLAQAYVSDHSAPEKRTKAFGIIGIAFGIGFLFGPFVSGELANFGHHVPFMVAAGMSATSVLCTYVFLDRRVPPQASGGHAALPAGRRPGAFDIRTYVEYFRRPQLGGVLVQFFLFSFAFSCFTSNFALFAERRFVTEAGKPWGPEEVGRLFAYSGLLGIVLQGGILGRLVKRYGERKLIVAAFVAAVAGYATLGVASKLEMLLVAATILSFGNGVLRPAITARITQVVGRDEQGTAIGISQSLGSIALILAPPTGGFLIREHHLFAWAMVASGVSALGLLWSLKQRSAQRAHEAAAAAAVVADSAEPAP